MKKILGFLFLAAVCATGLLHAQQPEMTAEQKAEMEAWMKAGTPGAHHEALAAMVGTWDVAITMWEKQGAPPSNFKGSSEQRLVLGGRWVEQRFRGEVMGMPFEGLGYFGYDNVRGRFLGTWMDSMSTSMMTMEGEPQKEKGVFRSAGSMADPLSGRQLRLEDETRVVSPDRLESTMWLEGKDGKMFKHMEFVYTRKK